MANNNAKKLKYYFIVQKINLHNILITLLDIINNAFYCKEFLNVEIRKRKYLQFIFLIL